MIFLDIFKLQQSPLTHDARRHHPHHTIARSWRCLLSHPLTVGQRDYETLIFDDMYVDARGRSRAQRAWTLAGSRTTGWFLWLERPNRPIVHCTAATAMISLLVQLAAYPICGCREYGYHHHHQYNNHHLWQKLQHKIPRKLVVLQWRI